MAAGMILAKKFIFSISRSFPQTQSMFLRSSSSSTHKFSTIATTFTASAKEKLAETGEQTTVMMSQKVKHKATESSKDRTKQSAQKMKETTKTKAEERTKDTGRRSVADKASESSAQNVKGKTKNMAGKTDEEAKEKQKHWMKPPEGCHILSTDGSVREDIAGIGGVIRDEKGSIVAAFAAGIPNIAPIHVIEIKAIVEGVKMAKTIGVTKLIINSDSMYAVDVINGRLKAPCEARDDIILLKSMKGSFTIFEVRHVCRDANRPADFLASFCKNETTLVFNSENCPEKLKVLAAQDVKKKKKKKKKKMDVTTN